VANRSEALIPVPPKRPDGILVLGSFDSGVEALGSALRSVATGKTDAESGFDMAQLTAMNDALLDELGGGVDDPPDIAPSDVAHVLQAWSKDALEIFQSVFGATRAPETGELPWIWADPRNAILAPFWLKTLKVPVVAFLVHRAPGEIIDMATRAGIPTDGDPSALWERLNRSALAAVSGIPTMVVGYQDLVENSGDVFTRVSKFLTEAGISTDGWHGNEPFLVEIDKLLIQAPAVRSDIPHHINVLDQLLTRFEASPPSDSIMRRTIDDDIVGEFSKFYDANYYLNSYDDIAYSRDEPHWINFFNLVANRIVADIAPARTLDIGCAIGLLVETLRERHVDARGIDVSEWALAQIPESLQAFCTLGSITDELDGEFDLITCIEVLEHLPRSMAGIAIGNLCAHTDLVLFSSTPDEFKDPTHLNVETPAFWSRLFATNGFLRDFDFDASFLAPQAVLYRRSALDVAEVVDGYERVLRDVSATLRASYRQAVHEHDLLADQFNDLNERIGSEDLRAELAELEARRSAEAVAATDALFDYETRQYHLVRTLENVEAELKKSKAHIDGILQTRLYRYTWPLRKNYFLRRTAKRAPELVESAFEVHPMEPSYARWLLTFDTLDKDARARLRGQVDALPDQPLISILLPVYNPPVQFLTEAIDSVRSQIYPNWELCIVDDCSTDPSIPEALIQLAATDSRIKFSRREHNGHISVASNTALSMASGSWVACLDHDDRLAESALAHFALTISTSPDAGVIYSDEDKISEAGGREDPFFKPEFDPLLLLGQNYLCHLSMYRKDLIDRVGGFREGYEGSQDWDLALRVTEDLAPEQVLHIPRVLYHWRVHPESTAKGLSAKSYAAGTGEIAVRDHLQRVGADGEVISLPAIGWNRVKWHIPASPPMVSIVIPTRDGRLLSRCIESIRNRSTYPHVEILVVDNGSLGRETLEYLRVNESWLTVIRDENPFNYPEINNRAVMRSSGEVICLLNDDTEVLGGDWLEEMVGQLLRPSIGAVGAKLYYSSGQIQHAGVVLGIGGVAGHLYRMSDRLFTGDHGRMQLPHSLSAVTAACMVVRREAWNQIRGMDAENLPVAFNDIDFCLRLREAGWGVTWTPFAELIHHESISRGPDTEGERAIRFASEIKYMKKRWGSALREDPAYSPNLTLFNEHCGLAWPPRVPRT